MDVPKCMEEGIARLIYAYLGDVDVRDRWRAAHVLRGYARFGYHSLLKKVVSLYGRRAEPVVSLAESAFYWISARAVVAIRI